MYPNVPIFVTGDYNNYYDSDYLKYLFEGLSMESGMLVAEQGDGTESFSHPLGTLEGLKRTPAIDHIGVTTDLCDVKLHRVIFDDIIAKGSDHSPRFIDVKLKSK